MNKHPPFPTKKYDIIYADPPWDYKGQLQHTGPGGRNSGGAIRHYPTVAAEEMEKWDIGSMAAEDCLLFMWSSSPHLDQAIELGKAWGFNWATIAFIWDKQKTNPGFYTLSQCELCLVFKRGKIPRPRGSRNVKQFLSVMRENHSKKPDEIRYRIECMFPSQEKIELFARKRISGWDCWGYDVEEELDIYNIIESIYPGKFISNTDDIIQRDFDLDFRGYKSNIVRLHDEKQIILYNDCYWHRCEGCGYNDNLPNGLTSEQVREKDLYIVMSYFALGYDVLVVWRHELESITEVINKIRQFVENPVYFTRSIQYTNKENK